jgi:hypothetical protein
MKNLMLVAISLAALAYSENAVAGLYSDDLSRCLVKSSSQEDNNTLMRWLFSAMAVNPAITSLTSITPAQHDAFNKAGAELFERLVLKDCRTEAVTAFRYEGADTLGTSFRVLGEVAGRGLMSEGAASKELGRVATYLHQDQWEALGKEAGTYQGPVKPPSQK